eukprot:4385306-Amphidinium_carterae.1
MLSNLWFCERAPMTGLTLLLKTITAQAQSTVVIFSLVFKVSCLRTQVQGERESYMVAEQIPEGPWIIVNEEHYLALWTNFVKRVLSFAFTRKKWAFLGKHLSHIKRRGRGLEENPDWA